jgi:hypothetical protein
MNLPRLIPVSNLPFNLPPIKNNQAWALNQDTSPASLVLIEFVYNDNAQTTTSVSQESITLLNTSINQTLSSINSEINALTSRLTVLENFFNSNNFLSIPISPTG